MDPMNWLLKNRIGSLELSREVGPNLLRGLLASILLHGLVLSSFFVMTMIHAGDHTGIGTKPPGPIVVLPPLPHFGEIPPVVPSLPLPKRPDILSHPVPVPVDNSSDEPVLTPKGPVGNPGKDASPGTGTGPIGNGPTGGIAGLVPLDEIPSDTLWIPHEFEPSPLSINPNPEYPELAKLAGVSGKVLVKVFVDKQGTARKWLVQYVKPAGLGFDQEVLNVIPKWQFTPAIQQGNPIGVWVMIPFVFKCQK